MNNKKLSTRIIAFTVALVLVVGIIPASIFAADEAPAVTEIGTLDELKALRDEVNNGNTFAGKTFKLTADIDLLGEEWTPIGNPTNWFQGNFDGDGHTISNLKITSGEYAGLFGYIKSGPANYTPGIANLTVNNVDISGVTNGGAFCGGGYTTTRNAGNGGAHQFMNLNLTGLVKIEGKNVGGLVGMDWTDYQIGANNITVSVDNGSYINGTTTAGGVFASAPHASVENVTADIDVMGNGVVGGIAGNGGWDWNDLTYTGNVTLNVANASEDGKYSVATIVASLAENYYWRSPVICMYDLDGTQATLQVKNGDTVLAVSNGHNSNEVGAGWSNDFKYTDGGVYKQDVAIGDTKYFSIGEAVRASAEGDTITLLDNRKEKNVTIPADKNVTIDFNAKELEGNIINHGTLTLKNGYKDTTKYKGTGSIIPQDDATSAITSDGNLTLKDIYLYTSEYYGYYDFIDITGGTAVFVSGDYTDINISGDANVNIKNGTFADTYNTDTTADIAVSGDATLTIEGGTFDGNITKSENAEVTVWGGTFSQDPTSYLVGGFGLSADQADDGTWTVVKAGDVVFKVETDATGDLVVGDTVTVTVQVLGTDLAGAEWNLVYDNTKFEYTGTLAAENGVIFDNELADLDNGKIFELGQIIGTYTFTVLAQAEDNVAATFTVENGVASNYDDAAAGDTVADTSVIPADTTIVFDTLELAVKVDGAETTEDKSFVWVKDTSHTVEFVATEGAVVAVKVNGSDKALSDLTFSAVGTYAIDYTITKAGFHTLTGTYTVTITTPDYAVEVNLEDSAEADYVAGKKMVLVYTNVEGVSFDYAGVTMYDVSAKGYTYNGTAYTYVYAVIADAIKGGDLAAYEAKVGISYTAVAPEYVIAYDAENLNYDLNGSGELNLRDVIAAYGVYNNHESYFTTYMKMVLEADINADKRVDGIDTAAFITAYNNKNAQ